MNDDISLWDGTKNPGFMEYQKQRAVEMQAKWANDPEHQKLKQATEDYNALLSTVYRIVCFRNGRVYVGITLDFDKRRSQHLSALRKGKHNFEIQKDYNEFGEGAFFFETLETDIAMRKRDECEQKWMDFYRSYSNGYNMVYFDTKGHIVHKQYPRTPLWNKDIDPGKCLSELVETLNSLLGLAA